MKKNRNIETRVNIYTKPMFSKYSLKAIGKDRVKKDYKLDCSKRTDGDFILFQLTLDGYGIFIKDNKTYICKKSDMFICDIPSDTLYYLPTNSNSWNVLFIEVSQNFYPLYREFIKLNNNKYTINLKDYQHIETILLEMYNIAIIDKEKNKYYLEKLFFNFLIELFKIFDTDINSNSNISSIKKYIEANYNKKISLNELSEKFYISKFYMIKKFKEEFKLTPLEYLTEYRLKVAKKLLLNSNNTIEYVAISVGYSNANYFSKVFKKNFNVTPKEYIRNYITN